MFWAKALLENSSNAATTSGNWRAWSRSAGFKVEDEEGFMTRGVVGNFEDAKLVNDKNR